MERPFLLRRVYPAAGAIRAGLKVDGPYTPEMVVDGAVEFVGNDAGRAQSTIRQQASQLETAQVKIASPARTN